jgi:hypothetical protein
MGVLKNLLCAVAALAVPAILAISSPASASTVNLLTNGDFETGGLAGWTVNDLSNETFAANEDNNNLAFLGSVVTTGFLSQQVATTIGRTYTLSFDLSVYGQNTTEDESFTAGLDLQGPGADPLLFLTKGSVTANPSNEYDFTNYVLAFTATEAMTDITFANRFDATGWLLDNVSLTENNIAVTPLPGSAYLFMSGLGLIGFVAWRNKRGGFSRSIAA